MRDDRHWDQPTDSRYVFVETSTTRIIGALKLSFMHGTYEAFAYARSVGEFIHADTAKAAVEAACEAQEKFEAEQRALALAAAEAKRNQADGVAE